MMKGLIVVFVTIFSFFVLRRKQSPQQYLGVLLVFMGITIVGVANVMYVKSSKTAKDPALGLILMVISQVLQSFQFITEEKFVKGFDPLLAISIEGFCGMVLYIIILPVLYYIPCDDPDS
jgi:drug/metabolite transporter (DMT)-like permease